MKHRAEGPIGSFTVHSPADYIPRHVRTEWDDDLDGSGDDCR